MADTISEENDKETIQIVEISGVACAVIWAGGRISIQPITRRLFDRFVSSENAQKFGKEWDEIWQKAEILSKRFKSDPEFLKASIQDMYGRVTYDVTNGFASMSQVPFTDVRVQELIKTLQNAVDSSDLNRLNFAAAVEGLKTYKNMKRASVYFGNGSQGSLDQVVLAQQQGKLNREIDVVHEILGHGAQFDRESFEFKPGNKRRERHIMNDRESVLVSNVIEAKAIAGQQALFFEMGLKEPDEKFHQILNSVLSDNKMTEDELRNLKLKNPKKYDSVIIELRSRIFLDIAINYSNDTYYHGQALATAGYFGSNKTGLGKSDIALFKKFVECECRALGIQGKDFQNVWGKLMPYVYGEKEIPGFVKAFDEKGNLLEDKGMLDLTSKDREKLSELSIEIEKRKKVFIKKEGDPYLLADSDPRRRYYSELVTMGEIIDDALEDGKIDKEHLGWYPEIDDSLRDQHRVAPSPKKQIRNAAGMVIGQFASIIAAGHVGTKFREHQDAMANGGHLMHVEEKEKTLARRRADLALQIGGVSVIGSGLVLTGAKAAGLKAMQTTAGKVAENTIPTLGVGLGVSYGAVRATDGDWLGASLEWTSAALDAATIAGLGASTTVVGAPAGLTVAGACTIASMGIDTFLAARDGWRHPDGVNVITLSGRNGKPVMVKDENGKEHPAIGAILTYKNNRRNGSAVFYDQTSDGQVIPIMQGEYKNDKKEGEWVFFNEQGKPIEICHYKDGKLVGEYERLDENGSIIAKGNFTNGYFEECWTDENGMSLGIVKRSGNFKNGKPVGEWYVLTEEGKEFVQDLDKKIIKTKGDDGKEYTIDAQGNLTKWNAQTHEMEIGHLNARNEIVWEKKTDLVDSIDWNIEHGRDPVHYPTIGDPDYMPSMIQGGAVRNAPPMATHPTIRSSNKNTGVKVDPTPGRDAGDGVSDAVLSNTEERPKFKKEEDKKIPVHRSNTRMQHEMGSKSKENTKAKSEQHGRVAMDKRSGKNYYGKRPGGVDDVLMENSAQEYVRMAGHKKQKHKTIA